MHCVIIVFCKKMLWSLFNPTALKQQQADNCDVINVVLFRFASNCPKATNTSHLNTHFSSRSCFFLQEGFERYLTTQWLWCFKGKKRKLELESVFFRCHSGFQRDWRRPLGCCDSEDIPERTTWASADLPALQRHRQLRLYVWTIKTILLFFSILELLETFFLYRIIWKLRQFEEQKEKEGSIGHNSNILILRLVSVK